MRVEREEALAAWRPRVRAHLLDDLALARTLIVPLHRALPPAAQVGFASTNRLVETKEADMGRWRARRLLDGWTPPTYTVDESGKVVGGYQPARAPTTGAAGATTTSAAPRT